MPYWWICFLQTHSLLLHKMLIDGLELCGLLWCFYQLFGLWRHPFTAEDPLVSKWHNTKFLNLMKTQTRLHLGWPEGGYIFKHILIFVPCPPVGIVRLRRLSRRRIFQKALISMSCSNMPKPRWAVGTCVWPSCFLTEKIWMNGWPSTVRTKSDIIFINHPHMQKVNHLFSLLLQMVFLFLSVCSVAFLISFLTTLTLDLLMTPNQTHPVFSDHPECPERPLRND